MKPDAARLEISDLATEAIGFTTNFSEQDHARLKQIEVRVRRLRDTNAAAYSFAEMVLFICAFVEGDRAKIEHSVKESLKDSSGNSDIIRNASVTLTAVGNVRDSLTLTRRMVELYPDDLMILEASLSNFQIGMHFSEAQHVCDLIDKLVVNNRPKNWAILRGIQERIYRAFEMSRLSSEDLLQRLETGIAAVRAQGLEVRRQSRLTLNDGTFVAQLFVDATPRACADMNFEIAYALSDKFDDPGSSLFSMVCRPLSDAPEVKSKSVGLVA